MIFASTAYLIFSTAYENSRYFIGSFFNFFLLLFYLRDMIWQR